MSCLAEGQNVLHLPARSADFYQQDDKLLGQSARKKHLIKLKWRKEEEILTCNETPLAHTSAHAIKMKEDVVETGRHMGMIKRMPSKSYAWYLSYKLYAKNKEKNVVEQFAVHVCNTLFPVPDLFAYVNKQRCARSTSPTPSTPPR